MGTRNPVWPSQCALRAMVYMAVVWWAMNSGVWCTAVETIR